MDQNDQKETQDCVQTFTMGCISPVNGMKEEYESPFKRPREQSKVWDYFENLTSQQKAICRLCNKVLSTKTSGGHLKRHMEACLVRYRNDGRKYSNSQDKLTAVTKSTYLRNSNFTVVDIPSAIAKDSFLKNSKFGGDEIYKEIVTKSTSLENSKFGVNKIHSAISLESTPESASLKYSKFDVEQICKAITTMIVIDKQPFKIVENKGFRSLMAVACPGTEMMGKQMVKQKTISMYVKEREKIRELLVTCPGKICLTSSTWKTNLGDCYNCIAAHFIDHEWRSQKRVLRFKLAPPQYNSITGRDELALCMAQWNIEHKVFSISLEDLSPDDCAASMLKARLASKKYLQCTGVFSHTGCFSQVLNSIIQAALDLIYDITEKIRLCIKYVKQSPQRRRSFYIIARGLNLDSQRKLCTDSPSRWNTTYDMLDVACCYKEVFSDLEKHDKNFRYNLLEDEWEAVSAVCKFLKVFYEVTYTLSEIKHPTSNIYFKWVWKIYCRLLDAMKFPENFMTPMVKEMQSKFNQYWSDYSLVLSCAAILDPRCKIKFIEFCYTKLYGGAAEGYVGTVVSALYSLFDEYMQKTVSICTSGGTSAVSTDMSGDIDDPDGFEDYKTFQGSRSQTQRDKSQLDLYLEEASHDLNSEVDVLEYWRLSSVRFPELSRMARDVLAIQGSTVDTENAFRLGPPLLSPCHSSLKSKTIQALICLQDWMRAYDTTSNSGYQTSGKEDDDSSTSSDDEDDY